MKVLITNEKDEEQYKREFENSTEASEWVVSHLDLSKRWSITQIVDDGSGV